MISSMKPAEKKPMHPGRIALELGAVVLSVSLIYLATDGGSPDVDTPRTSFIGPAADLADVETANIRPADLPKKAEPIEPKAERQFMHVKLPSPTQLPGTPDKPKKFASRSHGDVQRFDDCLPACDTRDPLVVGALRTVELLPVEGRQPEIAPDPAPDAFPPANRVMRSGRALVERVVELPGDTLASGKHAFRWAVDALP
ncbi:hypothetical protein [Mesorhizobium sp. CN2-181]|uniref:hypothetical protein n=1 Tax=Mesorhizobium yinganensis TaxID=3157707 RepID=UPI0032B84068